MAAVRHQAEHVLPQMMHCSRCRADAVELLGADRSAEFQSCLNECAKITDMKLERPYVAVASFSGIQVDQHLGDATHLQVWKLGLGGFQFVENRVAPERGTGAQRWQMLVECLHDCRAILASGVGDTPRRVLQKAGMMIVETNGFIEAELHTVYYQNRAHSLQSQHPLKMPTKP